MGLARLEVAVQIAARMEECRRCARSLNREKYAERVELYKAALKSWAERNGLGVVEAIVPLIREIEQSPPAVDTAMATMWFSAAAVELCEDKKAVEGRG